MFVCHPVETIPTLTCMFYTSISSSFSSALPFCFIFSLLHDHQCLNPSLTGQSSALPSFFQPGAAFPSVSIFLKIDFDVAINYSNWSSCTFFGPSQSVSNRLKPLSQVVVGETHQYSRHSTTFLGEHDNCLGLVLIAFLRAVGAIRYLDPATYTMKY